MVGITSYGIYDIISFTGSREGMTDKQLAKVRLLLYNYAPSEVHHGDCVGADAEFHNLCRSLYGISVHIVIHPPKDDRYRAFCKGDVILEPRPYLERDKVIAKVGDLLIATPKHAAEVRRSGTWATVRYAKTERKPRIIVTPQGHAQHRGG
jgi:hypothetical protein